MDPISKPIQTSTPPTIQPKPGAVFPVPTSLSNYTSPPITSPIAMKAPATAQAPTVNTIAPDFHYQQGLKTAYQLYPEVPKGLLETIMMQESSMGTNKANQNTDAGRFGYLGGITKTGTYGDMVKNTNVKYAARDVPGAMDLSTPHGAIAIIASILAQKIRANYGGKINPEQIFELYNKYYKTESGAKLSKNQEQQFMNYFKHYSQN